MVQIVFANMGIIIKMELDSVLYVKNHAYIAYLLQFAFSVS
jgi:hypothetical protein